MKKLFTLILAILVLAGSSLTVLAANSTGGQTTITANVEPTYTVVIPANTTVDFNANQTAFGAIEVTAAQIHSNMCIKVTLTSDGKLENTLDADKIIPYTIQDSEGNVFTSATYLTKGDKTVLSIHITQDDWNAAYAGNYTDTVTFTVSYVNK